MNEWAQAPVQGLRRVPSNLPARAHPQNVSHRQGNGSPDRQEESQQLIMTTKHGALGSIPTIWPSNFPLDQVGGEKEGAEPKQNTIWVYMNLGILGFPTGLEARLSPAARVLKQRQEAGTHGVSHNQGSESFSLKQLSPAF